VVGNTHHRRPVRVALEASLALPLIVQVAALRSGSWSFVPEMCYDWANLVASALLIEYDQSRYLEHHSPREMVLVVVGQLPKRQAPGSDFPAGPWLNGYNTGMGCNALRSLYLSEYRETKKQVFGLVDNASKVAEARAWDVEIRDHMIGDIWIFKLQDSSSPFPQSEQ
jgi:hypothetical protein